MIKTHNYLLLLYVLLLFISACQSPLENKPPKPLPAPESEGAELLKTYCSNCHAAPHPSDHPADEWKNVIFRMIVNMTKRAEPTPSDAEHALLLEYLQKYAKQSTQ